jgi:hypothetical protein
MGVALLAEELLDIRLATCAYTDPALQGTRRLGFILEDRPAGSFAGDPRRPSGPVRLREHARRDEAFVDFLDCGQWYE